MAGFKVNVVVEKSCIHDSLRKIAQEIYATTGVMVESVKINWSDVSTIDKRDQIVGDLLVETRTQQS